MPALLIKGLPPVLHERLREEATRHHRSMNREVIAILEKELGESRAAALPQPVQPLKPISGETVVRSIREIRDRTR